MNPIIVRPASRRLLFANRGEAAVEEVRRRRSDGCSSTPGPRTRDANSSPGCIPSQGGQVFSSPQHGRRQRVSSRARIRLHREAAAAKRVLAIIGIGLSFEEKHDDVLRPERCRLALRTPHQRVTYLAHRSSRGPSLAALLCSRMDCRSPEENGREDTSWRRGDPVPHHRHQRR